MRKRHPNFIDRTGEVRFNTYGCRMIIIRYESKRDCDIQFDNGYVVYNANYDHFKKGTIKNSYHPLIFNKGYFGLGEAETHPNHKVCYGKWYEMLQRCYDLEYHQKQPTYINCSADENWHNYQNFSKWFHTVYNNEVMKGWQLDKDLFKKGNKYYSSKTCYLLPAHLNNMLSVKEKVSGKYPTGVVKDCAKYHASIHMNGKRERSSLCDTIEEASNLYVKMKEAEIARVAEVYKNDLDKEAYQKLITYKFNV